MNIKEIIEDTLGNIFNLIGINPDFTVKESGENSFNVSVMGDNLNFLIGFRGQSLDALQTLLKIVVFRKTQVQIMLTLDINGYRDSRNEKLQEMARTFIDKVRFFQKDIELPPMNPYERRQIHMFVSEYEDILSESTGEGNQRRIVLKLKKPESPKE